ncbi:MAG: carbohydrate-binding protein, partial [Bacteroidota bacterium]
MNKIHFFFYFLISFSGIIEPITAQTIQAENASKLSSVKVQSTNANADGSYLDYGGEGSYAEWQFASSTDQTVELKIKYSTGNSSRGLKLTVNGNNFGAKSPLTNTDDWEDWEITGWTNVALQAGNNTIRLTAVGAGPNLDRLNIVPNDDGGNNGGGNNSDQGSFSTLSVNASSLPSAYKVAVNGGIITDEVRIQLEEYWPDYVFAPSYSLVDLTQLAQFIQQN